MIFWPLWSVGACISPSPFFLYNKFVGSLAGPMGREAEAGGSCLPGQKPNSRACLFLQPTALGCFCQPSSFWRAEQCAQAICSMTSQEEEAGRGRMVSVWFVCLPLSLLYLADVAGRVLQLPLNSFHAPWEVLCQCCWGLETFLFSYDKTLQCLNNSCALKLLFSFADSSNCGILYRIELTLCLLLIALLVIENTLITRNQMSSSA